MYIKMKGDKQIKNPTSFKKEAYRDGIIRKRDKIGMGCMVYITIFTS